MSTRSTSSAAPEGQSRRMSAVEAVVNVAVGYVLAVLTQMAVFPVFGLTVRLDQHLGIALMFTSISLVRGYALRRFFNRLGT